MAVKLLKTALALAAVVAICGALVVWFWFQGQREPFTEAALKRDLAKQDENAVAIPPQRLDRLSDPAPQPNANRNLYFGELHLHTDQSFDAVLFGNRLTINDAYRFARGEKLVSGGMELMQLSRPLDFVAITDHAEGFGSRRHCGQSGLPLKLQLSCWISRTPNMATFKVLRKSGNGGTTKLERANSPYCRAVGLEQCIADAKADWADFMALADRHNEPGVFTAIKAYEYSPTLPDYGKYHRNVFFRGAGLPDFAISAWDAPTELELIHAGLDTIQEDIEACLAQWAATDAQVEGKILIGFQLDETGLTGSWVDHGDTLPFGVKTCFASAVYGVDWSHIVKHPAEITNNYELSSARPSGSEAVH